MGFLPPGAYFTSLLEGQPEARLFKDLALIYQSDGDYLTAQKGRLFSLHTHLALLKVVRDKGLSNELNALGAFHRHLGMPATERPNVSVADCRGVTPRHRHLLPMPVTLTPRDVACSLRLWRNSLVKTRAEYISNPHETPFHHMYVLYMQLIYLQTLDLDRQLSRIVVQMLAYSPAPQLPYDSVVQYRSEISLELDKLALIDLKREDSLPWNLLDMLYPSVLHDDSQVVKYLTNTRGGVKNVEKVLGMLRKKDVVDKIARYYFKRLNSLKLESRSNITNCERETAQYLSAVLDGDHSMSDFEAVCNTTNWLKCPQFCRGLNTFNELARSPMILKLLHGTAHPLLPKEASLDNQTGVMYPVIPFCFAGRQVTDMVEKLDPQQSFELPKGVKYGYNFCQHAKRTYSDLGICTSLSYGPKTNVRKGVSSLTSGASGSPSSPEYPQPAEEGRRVFEDGLLLVIDSWAFEDIVLATHTSVSDSGGKGSKRSGGNSMQQSVGMNNFQVLLHGPQEAPLMLHRQNYPLSLSKDGRDKDSADLPTFFTRVKVEVQDADENIKSVDLKKRKCRFEDETEGLEIFSVYTEHNCFFECRLKLARAKCNCVPWNFPFRVSDQVCNPLGKICFSRQFLWLSEKLTSVKGVGSPPCGCYPGCRSYSYIPVEHRQEKKSPKWLDTGWLTQVVSKYKYTHGVMDMYDKDQGNEVYS